MDENRCPTCGKELEYDEVSSTFFCENCNRIYDEDEASSSIRWFAETCLMWVPILNIIITMKTKDRLKRTIFTNMLMSMLISIIVCSFLFLFIIYNAKGNIYQDIIKSRNKFSTIMMHELEVELPEYKAIVLPTLEEYVQIEEKMDLNDTMLMYVDGSLISGENVREIINEYDKYYLISTFTIREKYGPSIYLPIGKSFEECDFVDSELGKYDTSISTEYTESEKVVDKSKIDNKKTIHYIYPTSYFKVKVIRDKNDKILGLQFTEEVM